MENLCKHDPLSLIGISYLKKNQRKPYKSMQMRFTSVNEIIYNSLYVGSYGLKDLGHFWSCYNMDIAESWDIWNSVLSFYPGKLYKKTFYKDVGSYGTCSLYDFSIDTLVWNVSQILWPSLFFPSLTDKSHHFAKQFSVSIPTIIISLPSS